ncbi:MAG: DUF6029 family protein [Bacteroidota bacterium]
MIRSFISTLVLSLCVCYLAAQEGARLSGSVEIRANFFQEDSLIGAFNTPQYDHQLYGAEGWLNLNYNYAGFDVGLRFDVFNQSNLLNPQGSYTAEGIGRWYVKKQLDKLHLSGGYLYDQIGSGIIFRAYEERPLLIDNALYGLRLRYDLDENWQIKAFTGRQKQQFDRYDTVLKGFNVEGYIDGNATAEDAKLWSLAPGLGIVAKTLSDPTTDLIVNTISTYTRPDSIGAQFNTYAITLYNTLQVDHFNWYIEWAYKTDDVLFDPFASRTNRNGTESLGKLVNPNGSVLYSSLSYAGKKYAVTLEGKRTDNFTFRTNPFVTLNQGMINFLPPLVRVNTYRLPARYAAATQELGERAIQVDLRYAPRRQLTFNLNFSNITDLEDVLLYREVFTEVQYKYKRKWQLTGGIQFQQYNQERFEIKPDVPLVQTITPYADFLYKIDRKKAIRTELQYMNTQQDFGSWLFGLVEYSVAPRWTFTISDMWNVAPQRTAEDLHYPRFDIFYNIKRNRFSLSYVKQVEGIVCSGGVCRLEPAFSGIRFTLNSTF